MTEKQAREILGDMIRGDGGLISDFDFVHWDTDQSTAELDGPFTADELQAIAWWMEHKHRGPMEGKNGQTILA